MVHCCVYICLNKNVHQSDNEKRYFFHRFPKDKSLRKQWLNASGRDGATFSLERCNFCKCIVSNYLCPFDTTDLIVQLNHITTLYTLFYNNTRETPRLLLRWMHSNRKFKQLPYSNKRCY